MAVELIIYCRIVYIIIVINLAWGMFVFDLILIFFFFFQAEDGIRDYKVTGVQTCALPICPILVVAAPLLFILTISRCGSAPASYSDRQRH